MKGQEDHSRRLTLVEPRRGLHTFLLAEPVVGQWIPIIILPKAYLHVENAYLSLPLLSAITYNLCAL